MGTESLGRLFWELVADESELSNGMSFKVMNGDVSYNEIEVD